VLLLPLVGIVVLGRSDASRRPLAEREAALAVDLQRWRHSEPRDGATAQVHGAWTAPTMAVVGGMPRLVGNRELQLRSAGLIAGALALGVLAQLGTRLFAPRVGIAAALLLLALPAGRQLLGAELANEPFYLLAMLVALLAIREMAEARVAAVFAGVAAGIAIAVAGLDGLWLAVLALAWLRVHQGLGVRSASVIIATTAASATVSIAAGWLAYGIGAGLPPLPPTSTALGYLDPALLRPAPAARELFPLLPLVLLGLWSMRTAWWRSMGFRFVLLWLVFAAASWVLVGSGAGIYVAVLLLAVSFGLLALEHARVAVSLPACAVALGLATVLWQGSAKQAENQANDRWAIREAGRFVARVIDDDRQVAASSRAAWRFAFYGSRPVEPVARMAPLPARADYLIVPRADFQLLRQAQGAPDERDQGATHRPLKRIAEFGNWVVARIPARDG
jgi:hypothetical protein